MRFILLTMLLAGCGGPATWKVGCMYVEVPMDLIESGKTIDYKNIEESSGLAEILFNRRYGQGAFCDLAAELTVQMNPTWWACAGASEGCIGEYVSLEGRIKVVSGGALLHEFIHAQEVKLGMFSTLWHGSWKDNGQYLLADEYQAATQPWWH